MSLNTLELEMEIEAKECPYEGDECDACAGDYCAALGGAPKSSVEQLDESDVLGREICLGCVCVESCSRLSETY